MNLSGHPQISKFMFGALGWWTLPRILRSQAPVLEWSLRSLISAGRRVPLALRSALKEELDRLTSLGVIKPVDEPTNWVNNIIIAMKPLGDLQISIDLKDLKKPLKRERY